MKLNILKSNLKVTNIDFSLDHHVPIRTSIDYKNVYSENSQYLSYRSNNGFYELLIGKDYGELLKVVILKFEEIIFTNSAFLNTESLIYLNEAVALSEAQTASTDSYRQLSGSIKAVIQNRDLLLIPNNTHQPLYCFLLDEKLGILSSKQMDFTGFIIFNLKAEDINIFKKLKLQQESND